MTEEEEVACFQSIVEIYDSDSEQHTTMEEIQMAINVFTGKEVLLQWGCMVNGAAKTTYT